MRIFGEELDVEALLQMKLFEPSSIFRRGEPRRRSQPDGERLEHSGICVTVSEAEWADLPGQVEDAMQFLDAHKSALERVARLPGLSWFVLDFPSDLRIGSNDVAAQTDSFPAPLLRAAGELGLGIELTTYG